MIVEKKDRIESNNIRKVIKAYYKFFENLYGARRIPLIKKEVEYSMNPNHFVDKVDGNLKSAIQAITTASYDPDFYVLNAKDDNGNIMAIARVKVIKGETWGDWKNVDGALISPLENLNYIHVADIVFLENVTMEEGSEIYTGILEYLYTHALKEETGYTYISVEIPKDDDLLLVAAEDCGYERIEENKASDCHFRTIVMEKSFYLNKAEEKGEDFGRNRTR